VLIPWLVVRKASSGCGQGQKSNSKRENKQAQTCQEGSRVASLVASVYRRASRKPCALFVDETTAVTCAYGARQTAKLVERICRMVRLNAVARKKMKVNASRDC
jgi:hypothetical protein